MVHEASDKRSLTDRIVDKMLATIELLDEFEPAKVNELRKLAANGDLKKPTKIIKVIKPD